MLCCKGPVKQTYCQAACQGPTWFHKHNQPSWVKALLPGAQCTEGNCAWHNRWWKNTSWVNCSRRCFSGQSASQNSPYKKASGWLQDFFFLGLNILRDNEKAPFCCIGISEQPSIPNFRLRTNWSALNLSFEGSVEESLLRMWSLSETRGRWDFRCMLFNLGSRSVGLFLCLQDLAYNLRMCYTVLLCGD